MRGLERERAGDSGSERGCGGWNGSGSERAIASGEVGVGADGGEGERARVGAEAGVGAREVIAGVGADASEQ